jgi:hypothetical protein
MTVCAETMELRVARRKRSDDGAAILESILSMIV